MRVLRERAAALFEGPDLQRLRQEDGRRCSATPPRSLLPLPRSPTPLPRVRRAPAPRAGPATVTATATATATAARARGRFALGGRARVAGQVDDEACGCFGNRTGVAVARSYGRTTPAFPHSGVTHLLVLNPPSNKDSHKHKGSQFKSVSNKAKAKAAQKQGKKKKKGGGQGKGKRR